MRIDFLTIFPGMFPGMLDHGLLQQASQKRILEFQVHDLRNYAHDRHRSVDDVSYGGGPGMVFKPEPVFEAVETIREEGALVILPSPQGIRFSQEIAEELAQAAQLIFLCARYEGVDERICDELIDCEISIGDFVTMGGEVPSVLMVEAIARFVPGVVGDRESVISDSFQNSLLDFPHYTRPEEYRGKKVPSILLSGHHEEIRKWRRKMALKRTLERRPDLMAGVHLNQEDREMLEEIKGSKVEKFKSSRK